MKKNTTLKNKNQKNTANIKKILNSSQKNSVNYKNKNLTKNKFKHRYETYMKFVHLISRGLRQICSIFNHDLQIEYRNEITRKNNVEKDLRNLTKKKMIYLHNYLKRK